MLGGDSVSIVAAGLPNIIGNVGGITLVTGNEEANGAFAAQHIDNSGAASTVHREMISFNASRCSSIYGNSTTVQPPSFAFIAQIKF